MAGFPSYRPGQDPERENALLIGTIEFDGLYQGDREPKAHLTQVVALVDASSNLSPPGAVAAGFTTE
jgi:hypothetical protein